MRCLHSTTTGDDDSFLSMIIVSSLNPSMEPRRTKKGYSLVVSIEIWSVDEFELSLLFEEPSSSSLSSSDDDSDRSMTLWLLSPFDSSSRCFGSELSSSPFDDDSSSFCIRLCLYDDFSTTGFDMGCTVHLLPPLSPRLQKGHDRTCSFRA